MWNRAGFAIACLACLAPSGLDAASNKTPGANDLYYFHSAGNIGSGIGPLIAIHDDLGYGDPTDNRINESSFPTNSPGKDYLGKLVTALGSGDYGIIYIVAHGSSTELVVEEYTIRAKRDTAFIRYNTPGTLDYIPGVSAIDLISGIYVIAIDPVSLGQHFQDNTTIVHFLSCWSNSWAGDVADGAQCIMSYEDTTVTALGRDADATLLYSRMRGSGGNPFLSVQAAKDLGGLSPTFHIDGDLNTVLVPSLVDFGPAPGTLVEKNVPGGLLFNTEMDTSTDPIAAGLKIISGSFEDVAKLIGASWVSSDSIAWEMVPVDTGPFVVEVPAAFKSLGAGIAVDFDGYAPYDSDVLSINYEARGDESSAAYLTSFAVSGEGVTWRTWHEDGTKGFFLEGSLGGGQEEWERISPTVPATGAGSEYSLSLPGDYEFVRLVEVEERHGTRSDRILEIYETNSLPSARPPTLSSRWAEYAPRKYHILGVERDRLAIEEYVAGRAALGLETTFEIIPSIDKTAVARVRERGKTGPLVSIWQSPPPNVGGPTQPQKTNTWYQTLILAPAALNGSSAIDAYAVELTAHGRGLVAVSLFDSTTATTDTLVALIEAYSPEPHYVVIFGRGAFDGIGATTVPFFSLPSPQPVFVPQSGNILSFGAYEGTSTSVSRMVGFVPANNPGEVFLYLDKAHDQQYNSPDLGIDMRELGWWVGDHNNWGNSGPYAKALMDLVRDTTRAAWQFHELTASEIGYGQTARTDSANAHLQGGRSLVALFGTASLYCNPADWLSTYEPNLYTNLDSTGRYTTFLSMSCHANAWDHEGQTCIGSPPRDHVMTEMLKIPLGGAINSIGPTRGCYQHYYYAYLVEFMKQYDNCRSVWTSGQPTIGWLHKEAKNALLARYPGNLDVEALCSMLALMGDPTRILYGPMDNEVYQYVGVELGDDAPRVDASVSAARPNPFNPRTSIVVSAPAGGRVLVEIYDVRGRRVRTLADETVAPGDHEIAWTGKNDDGRDMQSGVYFYRVEVDGDVSTGKVVLVR